MRLIDEYRIHRLGGVSLERFIDELNGELGAVQADREISEADSLEMGLAAATAMGQGNTPGAIAARDRIKYLRFLEKVGIKDGS